MDVIFMPKHLICKRLQCVHILSLIMQCHTGNAYCNSVLSAHVSIFLTKKQIISIQKKHPKIGFQIYHIITRCTAHVRIPLKEKNIRYMCKQESSSDKSTKIYTRKELLMMDTTISDFIPDTIFHPSKSWLCNLPHVCILGINHCGEM